MEHRSPELKPAMLAFDVNGDGRLTIADIWDGLEHLLFLPGDLALRLIIDHAPAVADFLELSPADYGSPVSKFVGVGIWLLVFIAAGVIYNAIRNLDRALTAYLSGRYQAVKRALRVTRRRLVSFVGMLRQRRRNRGVEIGVSAVELARLEAAVLRCHADVGDYRVLTAEEIAETLKVSLPPIRKALRLLHELRLIERSLGTDEGREGHHITQAGQIYLINS